MNHPVAQNATRGIALMVAGLALFGGMDTAVKLMAADYNMIQILWARFFFQALFFMALFWRGGIVRQMKTARPGLQIARSLVLLIATMMFFNGLRFLPLADAVAITFISPLIVAGLAMLVLGEHVSAKKWVAICAGFIGVLIIIRPGLGVMHWAAVLPLGMAICFSIYQILTRIAARTESATTSQLWSPLAGVIAMTAMAPFFWTEPDLLGWAMLAFIGLCGGIGHYLIIRAYLVAEASTLSPFVYVELVWTVILGYFVFGDFPDAFTLGGAAIVILSGLYIFRSATRS